MDTVTVTPASTAPPAAPAPAPAPAPDDLRPLPLWYFGFEAVLAAAWDLCSANPRLIVVVGALVVANIVVSLTMLRSRVRMAKRLWRGKSTRRTALGLLGLRVGSHVVLHAVGAAITSPAVHYAFAAVMGVLTLALLWYTQRTALRALAREAAAAPAGPAAAAVPAC